MIYKLEDTKAVRYLFEKWDEGVIWGCLEKVMGDIYVDNLNNPTSAMAILGDFCYFAGKLNEELVMFKPDKFKNSIIITSLSIITKTGLPFTGLFIRQDLQISFITKRVRK